MREHYPCTACVLITSSVYVRITFTHMRSKKLRVTCCICNFVENENKKNWFWLADFPYWQGLGRARDWVRAVANCSMELFWRSCRGLWVKICPQNIPIMQCDTNPTKTHALGLGLQGMPISLGFWEWGCPKLGNAPITVTAQLQALDCQQYLFKWCRSARKRLVTVFRVVPP